MLRPPTLRAGLLLALLALPACPSPSTGPADAATGEPDAAEQPVPADAGPGPDAGPDAGTVPDAGTPADAGAGDGGTLRPCLEDPNDLPRPPGSGLPCELLPPGFTR